MISPIHILYIYHIYPFGSIVHRFSYIFSIIWKFNPGMILTQSSRISLQHLLSSHIVCNGLMPRERHLCTTPSRMKYVFEISSPLHVNCQYSLLFCSRECVHSHRECLSRWFFPLYWSRILWPNGGSFEAYSTSTSPKPLVKHMIRPNDCWTKVTWPW